MLEEEESVNAIRQLTEQFDEVRIKQIFVYCIILTSISPNCWKGGPWKLEPFYERTLNHKFYAPKKGQNGVHVEGWWKEKEEEEEGKKTMHLLFLYWQLCRSAVQRIKYH